MAAFQQRRAPVSRPAPLYSPPSSDNLPAQQHDEEDDAVLLFAPPSPSHSVALASSSSWAQIPPPSRARAGRTISFTSQSSLATTTTTTSSSAGGPASSDSLGSPQQAQAASLLPSHDGTGAFLPADSTSLVLSTAQLDSASSTSLASPSLASTSSSSRPFPSFPAHARRPSAYSQISFASASSASFEGGSISEGVEFGRGAGASGEWGEPSELTEENLAASLSSSYAFPSPHLTQKGEEREGQESAGCTSGSEGEEKEAENKTAPHRLQQQQQAQHSADADERALALSPAALSSGLLPPRPRSSSRRRLPFAPISAPSQSSSRSASISHPSYKYKRRHRRAGGREGSVGSQKKRSASLNGGRKGGMEVGMWEEEEEKRARRMREVVREREEEGRRKREGEREKERVGEVLFGHSVLAYFYIPPSHLSLIASAQPSFSTSATPTPTGSPRSTSPSRYHGVERLAREAGKENRFPGQVEGGGEGGEVSDAETEHPSPSSPSIPDEGEWATYFHPPSSTSRRRSLPSSSFTSASSAPPPTRSKSAADLSHLSGLGLSLTYSTTTTRVSKLKRPELSMRRSSSFAGVPSSSSTSFSPPSLSHPGPPAAVDHLAREERMSHAERLYLDATTPPLEKEGKAEGEGEGEAAAWGGEVDSLQLALSYWRGFLRRLGMGVGPGGVRGQEEGEEEGEGERADFPASSAAASSPVVEVYA
ncbi:hypothetical protein JCM8547_007511 [Rhodosporidiobolus lusitaniae]